MKRIYDRKFFDGLIYVLKKVYPAFDSNQFMTSVISDDWGSLELKQRIRRITRCLIQCLPESYEEALDEYHMMLQWTKP